MGFALGVVNAVPQYAWSRDHAYHHKTNGDWERYRGIGDFLSITEFNQLSPADQKLYGILRQPLMTLPGGFFYLAIKPRIALILGAFDFLVYGIQSWRQKSRRSLAFIINSHHSKHWQTRGEFWDLLFNNICVIGSWFLLSQLIGFQLFFGVYSLVLTFAGAIFICVFFVQHNFEGAYAHETEGWDFVQGAIAGSSYLDMPTWLRWFTADISYHNIHHLSERIPNYNLAACHHHNRHLLTQVKVIRLLLPREACNGDPPADKQHAPRTEARGGKPNPPVALRQPRSGEPGADEVIERRLGLVAGSDNHAVQRQAVVADLPQLIHPQAFRIKTVKSQTQRTGRHEQQPDNQRLLV